MTVEKIENVIGMVEELRRTHNPVVSVWEYTHLYCNRVMFAVFTTACYCDIYESPYVLNPKLIFRSGKFMGSYVYLNG
jgi:hypothetical protein